jgi:YfiH family protein
LSLPLLIPDWPAPPGVRAACSTRAGGVSAPPFDSLNLGDHVGDREDDVAENRRRFAQALGVRPVFMAQVHGTRCAALDVATPDAIEADACSTRERGVACTIMVADCLPVLLCDARGTTVAAAHAGWRGLAAGAIESALATMEVEGAHAWLGPCIGPSAFEVGPEVREAFVSADEQSEKHFLPHREGKYLADLPGLARRRLARAGLASIHGNDGSDAWCTVANATRFFSHRRDRVSGRFAAAVWLG